MSFGLVPVGYWAATEKSCGPTTTVVQAILGAILPSQRLPCVYDFIDPTWNAYERACVVEYLQRGRRYEAYMGYSVCRICGQDNGCLDLTDDVYIWPDGLVHYVRDHAVRPPREFVVHALSQRKPK